MFVRHQFVIPIVDFSNFVRFFGIFHFSAVHRFNVIVWLIDRFRWLVMLKFVQNFVDVSWHAEVDGSVFVVPFQ